MDENPSVIEKSSVSHIHWTAIVSCGFSGYAALVFLIIVPGSFFPTDAPIEQFFLLLIPWLITPLYRILTPVAYFLPMPLYLFSCLFASLALAIVSKRQWRKGRGMAIAGAFLSGITLTLFGAWVVWMVFFARFHFVG